MIDLLLTRTKTGSTAEWLYTGNPKCSMKKAKKTTSSVQSSQQPSPPRHHIVTTQQPQPSTHVIRSFVTSQRTMSSSGGTPYYHQHPGTSNSNHMVGRNDQSSSSNLLQELLGTPTPTTNQDHRLRAVTLDTRLDTSSWSGQLSSPPSFQPQHRSNELRFFGAKNSSIEDPTDIYLRRDDSPKTSSPCTSGGRNNTASSTSFEFFPQINTPAHSPSLNGDDDIFDEDSNDLFQLTSPSSGEQQPLLDHNYTTNEPSMMSSTTNEPSMMTSSTNEPSIMTSSDVDHQGMLLTSDPSIGLESISMCDLFATDEPQQTSSFAAASDCNSTFTIHHSNGSSNNNNMVATSPEIHQASALLNSKQQQLVDECDVTPTPRQRVVSNDNDSVTSSSIGSPPGGECSRKKRQRNNEACRESRKKKKIERVNNERRVVELRDENAQLREQIAQLKEERDRVKATLMERILSKSTGAAS